MVSGELIYQHDRFNQFLLSGDSHEWLKANDLAMFKPNKTLILFIGGAMDDVYRPLLNGVFIPYYQKHAAYQDCFYATHAAIPQILNLVMYWHSFGQKIALVGHSWGGNSALKVARKIAGQMGDGITIELLVTLDPVSRRYFQRNIVKPVNVKRWLNVHIDYSRASMEYSNLVARLGGCWGHCRNADRNICLNWDTHKNKEITHTMANRQFVEVESEIACV